jgi:predicted transcriptional regulator
VSGNSKRPSYQTPRRRKSLAQQEAVIRAKAGNRILWQLADEFGVTHETVRTVLRQESPAPAKIR